MSWRIPLWSAILGVLGALADDKLFDQASWFTTAGAVIGYFMWVSARLRAIGSGKRGVHVGSTIFVAFVSLCVFGILVQLWRTVPVDEKVFTDRVAWAITAPVALIVTLMEWGAASRTGQARPLPTGEEFAEIVRDAK